MSARSRFARDWGARSAENEDLLQRPRLLVGAIMVSLVLLGAALAYTAGQIANAIDVAVLEDEHARAGRMIAAYTERFGPLQERSAAELGRLLSLDELRLVPRDVAAGKGDTRLDLLPGQGPEGMVVLWRPHLYGSAAYAVFAPKRLPVGALAVLALITMLYYLYRLAGDLERRRQAAQDLAGRDPLTGLLNRLGFDTALRERFGPLRQPFALFCLDLDGFKGVNDRHGHGAGDLVLQGVAERLGQIVGAEAVLGRLGGDEFAILLDGAFSRDDLEALGHRLRAAICMPYPLGGITARIGVSIGIAEAPGQASSPQGLVAIADAALYRAKSGQGDGVCLGSLGERTPRGGTPGGAQNAA